MKKKIRIYSDEGVSTFSLNCLLDELDDLSMRAETLSSKQVKESSWEKDTSIFIMPGGRDLFFLKRLKKDGLEKISNFVTNGGSYLGICAGAYFGAAEVVFEKGSDLEVLGKRYLNFTKAKAIGPAYKKPKFSYKNFLGAKAASLEFFKNREILETNVFFYGGCYFDSQDKMDIIGQYSDLDLAAIIQMKVKKGRVILSGVHVECSSNNIDALNEKTLKLVKDIEKTENIRKKVFSDILKRLL